MKAIQTQACITGIRSKVDRSLGLTIATPELSTNERALFMEYQGIECNIMIEPIDATDGVGVEKIDKELRTKTQSQRLRGVLYILWEQQGKQGEFEEFYRSQTEKIIEHYKGKLDN